MSKARLNTTIRNKEMNAAILPLKRKTDNPDAPIEVFVFTVIGKQDELVNLNGETDGEGYPLLYDRQDVENGPITKAGNLDDAYAQMTIKGNIKRYYLKRNGAGRLFDPHGLYDEHKKGKQLQLKGLDIWRFKEVAEAPFISYVNYLRSKNKAFFHNAEREVM